MTELDHSRLRKALLDELSTGTWKVIENNFKLVDLDWREDFGTGNGKPKYVSMVLATLDDKTIQELARRCVKLLPRTLGRDSIEDAVLWLEAYGIQKVSAITREAIASTLDKIPLIISTTLTELVTGSTNVYMLSYSGTGRLLADQIFGDPTPVTHKEALGRFGFQGWSDRRVFRFLEAMTHPKICRDALQNELVDGLNQVLARDGYIMEECEQVSGYPVFKVADIHASTHSRPKNLIFASKMKHFQPIVGFADALDNDVVVLENEDTCLVFVDPIPEGGLSCGALVRWYGKMEGISDLQIARKALGKRLYDSIGSKAEQRVFSFYYGKYREQVGEGLPALIPQVYVHYDPRLKKIAKNKFTVQRMDFLLLLPGRLRVVIEVDGNTHYTEDRRVRDYDIPERVREGLTPERIAEIVKSFSRVDLTMPSPKAYSDMVRSDRNLLRRGYHVYRLGGHEVMMAPDWEVILAEFFDNLLTQHGFLPP